MRLYLGVAVSVFALVACGSSESHPDSGPGGATGSADTGVSNGGAGGATGGTVGRDAAPSGLVNQDCAWLADCISSNNCSTQACIESCASQASSAAIVQYSDLLDCLNANPQCTTSDCYAVACAGPVAVCKGSAAPVDAGVSDAAAVPDAPAKIDGGTSPNLDAPAADSVPPSLDAGIDSGTPTQGYTTSGSCDIVVKIPNLLDSHTCWDYTLTVTANHNDGTEHYVAYKPTDVSGTQSACTSQSYSANQPGPWDSAALSASNLSHKKQACDIAGSGSGAKSVWTEGGACALAGSLGHCTDAVTNTWNPSTQVLSSSLVGAWSVP